MTEVDDGSGPQAAGSSDPGPPPTRQQPDVRARWLWIVTAGGTTLGVLVVVAVVLAFFSRVWWVPLVVAPVGVAAAAVGAHLRWCHHWWGTAELALEVGHGVVVRRATYLPYHRIQQIDVERGLLDRVVGLAKLTVHTASATTDASIPGLVLADARDLRRHLLTWAGRDDGV